MAIICMFGMVAMEVVLLHELRERVLGHLELVPHGVEVAQRVRELAEEEPE